FVLGGDWDKFCVPQLPFDAVWPIVCTARWRTLSGYLARGLFLSLIHPAGQEVFCHTLVLTSEATQGVSYRWIQAIGARLDTEGSWTVRLHSGGFLLAEAEIRVVVQH